MDIKRVGPVVGLLAAGAITGGVVAAPLPASAADNGGGNTSTSTSAATTASIAPAAPPVNARSSTPVRPDEKAVSGTLAAKIKAAAIQAVPGATVYRVETDADGAAYEAHLTKPDGSLATVKCDKNGKVTGVESGMGTGTPGTA